MTTSPRGLLVHHGKKSCDRRARRSSRRDRLVTTRPRKFARTPPSPWEKRLRPLRREIWSERSSHDHVHASSRGFLFQPGRNGCDPRRDLVGDRLGSKFVRVRADSSFSLGRADDNSDCGNSETVSRPSSRQFAGTPLLQLGRSGCDSARYLVGDCLGSKFARTPLSPWAIR